MPDDPLDDRKQYDPPVAWCRDCKCRVATREYEDTLAKVCEQCWQANSERQRIAHAERRRTHPEEYY